MVGRPSHAGQVEDRDDILAASLAAAYRQCRGAVRRAGRAAAGAGTASASRTSIICSAFRAFSALNIPVPGGTGTLTPSFGAGTHGPSWRMVVELGPGGSRLGNASRRPERNPASAHYMDLLRTWRRGELEPLEVPAHACGAAHPSATLTLEPR